MSVMPDQRRRLALADLTRLYRPVRAQSLRVEISGNGGISNVLWRLDPLNRLRRAVVARLRFESLLELGCQAGAIRTEDLGEDNDRLSVFFPLREGLWPVQHWLPALFAGRLSGRHDYSAGRKEWGEDPQSVFYQFVSLDATIREDPEIDALLAELSVVPSDATLLDPFLSPQRFVTVMTAPPRPSVWGLGWFQKSRNERQAAAARGLRTFLLFCPELVELLTRAGELRETIWHYYAGVFDQFGPQMTLARSLRLAADVVEIFGGWGEAIADRSRDRIFVDAETAALDAAASEATQRTLARYREALALLGAERYVPPPWWHRASGGREPGRGTDEFGGPASGALLPPVSPLPPALAAPRLPLRV